MRHALLFAAFSFALHAQDADSHYQRARDLLKSPEKLDGPALDRATDDLKAALRLRPDFVDARIELGRIQVLRREYDAAVQTASEILGKDPKNLKAHLLRANALVGMGKAGVARLFLEDALKLYPDDPDILFNLGTAALADRQYQNAEDTFSRLWKAEPSDIRSLRGIALTFIAREQTARAFEIVRQEAAKQPDRRDIRTLAGEIALQAGNNKAALDAFQAVVQATDKPTPLELAQLGDAYRRNGDLETAIDYLRKAVAATPGEVRFLPLLAEALDMAGKKKEAERMYRDALAIEPKNPVLLNNLAWLLADGGGDLKEALAFAQRARAVLPTNPEVLDTVGWIYLKSRMFAEAEALFEQLTVRQSNNPVFRYHFALALAEQGEKDRALRQARRALEDKPAGADLRNIETLIRKLEAAK